MPLTIRKVELLRAAWGAALLVAPTQVLTRVHHLEPREPAVVILRVLGARQVAQAIVAGVDAGPEVLATSVWVDAAHGLTAVAFAASGRSRIRGGLVETVLAASWAAAAYRDLTGRRGSTALDRPQDRLARTAMRWLPGGKRLAVPAS